MVKPFLPSQRFIETEETIVRRVHQNSLPWCNPALRILNWNIAKNNRAAFGSHQRVRSWLSEFAAILERYNPDLIFLQEVRLCAETQHLGELTDMGWNFAPNFIDTYHNCYAGVLTAAKASCLTRKAVKTQHYEPVTQTPKVSLVVEYPFPTSAQTLLTINSHLINFVDLATFKAQLHALEGAIAPHTGAIIFSGDFNTWNRSRWLMLAGMAGRLGLTQAKFPPKDAQNIKRFLLSPPLDHVFYRGLHQNMIHAKVLNHAISSDHKPMIVEFSGEM
ncbi:endonuclease/exonuclease/phosphatase family protein [Myxacorys almedinensis]|uniref:Endonuclease/exonuclease/phosphatase family protein n=1 Tax=Myxacorys almedinensis A TaxID=2690445 RepID=A0A8J8CIL3_9CYAN|nr:endonuclease/exonuclease/phosphatase family protein [Myxacorys almedinensis]NDJ17958.1 endonuclease/exonuclease/phosphatase family protein [Myxacorys almedinensis A]